MYRKFTDFKLAYDFCENTPKAKLVAWPCNVYDQRIFIVFIPREVAR